MCAQLFKHMPALAKIVGVLLSSAASFFSIGILLFLFLTVFSIIGLHVYGEIGPLEGVRGSFKDIYHSYIILFQARPGASRGALLQRLTWGAFRYRPTFRLIFPK